MPTLEMSGYGRRRQKMQSSQIAMLMRAAERRIHRFAHAATCTGAPANQLQSLCQAVCDAPQLLRLLPTKRVSANTRYENPACLPNLCIHLLVAQTNCTDRLMTTKHLVAGQQLNGYQLNSKLGCIRVVISTLMLTPPLNDGISSWHSIGLLVETVRDGLCRCSFKIPAIPACNTATPDFQHRRLVLTIPRFEAFVDSRSQVLTWRM